MVEYFDQNKRKLLTSEEFIEC